MTTTVGVLKRIGRVVMETAHCAQGPFALDGHFVMYAEGGTIEGIYESGTILVTPPPEPPLFLPMTGSLLVQEGVYEVTGGTGLFENVTGRLPFQVFVSVGEFGFAADMTWSIRMAIAGHIQFTE